jgi:hypothetical protein
LSKSRMSLPLGDGTEQWFYHHEAHEGYEEAEE